MKKFYGVLILAIVLLVVGSYNNHAEAIDYYLGVYQSGQEAYLDTSSIITKNDYVNGSHRGDNYTCTVKAVYVENNSYDIVHYEVYVGMTVIFLYKNGEEVFRTFHSRKTNYLEENPVEHSLVNYFVKLTEQNWNSVPEHVR